MLGVLVTSPNGANNSNKRTVYHTNKPHYNSQTSPHRLTKLHGYLLITLIVLLAYSAFS